MRPTRDSGRGGIRWHIISGSGRALPPGRWPGPGHRAHGPVRLSDSESSVYTLIPPDVAARSHSLDGAMLARDIRSHAAATVRSESRVDSESRAGGHRSDYSNTKSIRTITGTQALT